jgi:YidC/Oxa1 family membrane protein insertase
MKKQDLIPIVLIFALFLAYPTLDRKFISKIFPPKAKPAPAAVEKAEAPALPADTALAAPEAEKAAPAPEADGVTSATWKKDEPAPAPAPAEEEKAIEVLTTLGNERLEITTSTHGAGVVRAAILGYPSVKGSEVPVTFDFSDRPAAAPIGYPGLAPHAAFEIAASTDDSIVYRKVLPGGLVLTRTLVLGDGYQIALADKLENPTGAPVALSGYGLQSGFMENLPGEDGKQQVPLLGVDTLTGSDSVEYWSAKFDKWFPVGGDGAPVAVPGPGEEADHVDWAAVKNKYFVQILTPVDASADQCLVRTARGEPVRSSFMGIFPRTSYPFARVAADLRMPDYVLAAGQTLEQAATFYVGPKVYTELKANGPHQEDILQLGFWRVVGIWILKVMVWIQAHVWPYSYGVAIILLTFLIRIIFWPLNHKSMVSTRHMQEIQPLITAVREKYKSDPQKQQQEMMALYKEHKINPMGGCLPMLIQIPVFFALFVVLRGAIELRFSSFLWIADLSTPENLFQDVLPIGLNILPLFMGVTMWLQQKMTPTSDPQQQKMMMMMPVLFTFMFYSFPSGLSLYWSTNQVMMIVQLAWMKKFHPPLAAAKK